MSTNGTTIAATAAAATTNGTTRITTTNRPLQITIAGAGLAGLATAISLALATQELEQQQQQQHPETTRPRPRPRPRPCITLLEALPSLAPIGAGLQLTPNATRLLARWGLGEKVAAVCAEPARFVVHRYAADEGKGDGNGNGNGNGKVLALDARFSQRIRQRYGGHPFLDVHRGDLQALLFERASELGVQVKWGCRVAAGLEVDVRLSDGNDDDDDDDDDGSGGVGVGVRGTMEPSGEAFEADVLVGADGIWSRCREALLGRADPPLPTGDLAYRIVLTLDELGDDRELRDLVANPECHLWIGPNSHVVGYSVRQGTMYNLVLLCPDDLPSDVARQKGQVSEMKRLFEGWDPILTRLLDKVTKVDKWKLMHRPEMEKWVSDQGTLALIGDSCHPMLPYLAQGANSAMEDGAALGWCLAQVNDKTQLKRALRLYEQVRKVRGERVARETFLQRHQFHMPDGPEQEERDRIFASQLGKDEIDDSILFPSRWLCGIAQRWLYGYDAYAAIQAAFDEDPW